MGVVAVVVVVVVFFFFFLPKTKTFRTGQEGEAGQSESLFSCKTISLYLGASVVKTKRLVLFDTINKMINIFLKENKYVINLFHLI